LAGSAGADTVQFSDRSNFLAALGGTVSTIGFEGTAPNTYAYVGSDYSIEGITFHSNHMYTVDGEYLQGWFSQGTGDTLLAGYQNDGLATTDKGVWASLQGGTRAIGLDITLETGGTYLVTLSTGEKITGVLPGSVWFDGTSYVRGHDFVGFTADSDIASIRIDSTGGGWKIIDNFTTARQLAPSPVGVIPAAVVPVPLPAAASGGMALLTGLGIGHYKRRRQQLD